MNKDEYIPKIGEKVKLVNSGQNLTREMINIIEKNPIVEVLTYNNNHNSGAITFKNSEPWSWNYVDGHWKPIGKPNKSHNKALIKVLKEIT